MIAGVSGFVGGAVIRVRADNYILEGFDITAGGDLDTARLLYNLGHRTFVRDCVVHDSLTTGISGAAVSGSLTLHKVEVFNTGYGSQEHQIYVECSDVYHPDAVFRMEYCYVHDASGGNNVKSRVARNEIYYNWIEGATYHELDLIGADPSDQAPNTADLVREDSDVVGNVFYKLPTSDGAVARLGSDGTGSSNGRYRFVNNTMLVDRGWHVNLGIFKITGPFESLELHNNVFFRENGGALWFIRFTYQPENPTERVTGANNWIPSGTIGLSTNLTGSIFGSDPGFADTAALDLTPIPGSPIQNASALPTISRPGFPFPSPLPAPEFLPPSRAPYANDALLVRPEDGAIDIGALERAAVPPGMIFRPLIDTQPQSQSVNAGSAVTLSVSLIGTPPFQFQWYFNGTNLPGATNAEFTIGNFQLANVGNYFVRAWNDAGLAISDAAALSINLPPTITTQPASRTNLAGTSATFTVATSGATPLFYQWFFNGIEIASANSNKLTLDDVRDPIAGDYFVVVTNMVTAATSSVASLVVRADTNRPVVAVTTPLNNARLSNDFVTIIGSALDNVRVTNVVYLWNDPLGAFVQTGGSNVWSVTLPLAPGTNSFRVKSLDASANESLVVGKNFFRVAPSPLTLLTNGNGKVSTNLDGQWLEVGRNYTITALPGTNYLFANWSGGVTASTATLNFLMQSNLLLVANFVTNPFIALKGSYNGLFFDANSPSHESGGSLLLTLADKGTFSGRIQLAGNILGLTGKFGLDGKSTVTVLRTRVGKSPLTLSLDLDFAHALGNGDQLFGTVSNETWAVPLRADRAVWSAGNPATAFTNRYTLLIPGADVSAGTGYAIFTVDSLGRGKLAGAMGDGAVLGSTVPISKDSLWPLYLPLYVGPLTVTNGALVTTTKEHKGCFIGWLTFTNAPTTNVAQWIKTSLATNIFYPNGFTNNPEVWIAPYVAPAPGNRAINVTSGQIVLAGGNLAVPITNNFALTTNNVVQIAGATHSLKLSLSSLSGLLSGSFVHPAITNKATTIKGLVLQSQNFGAGYFLGTNQAGSVSFLGN